MSAPQDTRSYVAQATRLLPSDVIEEMRDWISDREWRDQDPDDVGNLAPVEVVCGVARYYDGGIRQFLRDSGYGPQVVHGGTWTQGPIR